MNYLGKKIKELREKNKLLFRQVAAYLECDTAYISKVENGQRNLNREQVEKLSVYFDIELDELITLWLADKVLNLVINEPLGKQGVKRALSKLNS